MPAFFATIMDPLLDVNEEFNVLFEDYWDIYGLNWSSYNDEREKELKMQKRKREEEEEKIEEEEGDSDFD